MTKAQIISELKSNAEIYKFHLPKDLEKKTKAELEVLLKDSEQAASDCIAYKNGAAVW